MLRSLQKEREKMLPASDAAPQNLPTETIDSLNVQSRSESATSSNLMSQNFASTEREQSRYVQATLIGMKARQQMNDQQQSALTSILNTAIAEYGAAETLGERYKVIKRTEKMFAMNQSNEVRKSAEETHLKAIKEDLEEKAQEAAVPKDENGNQIESLPIEGQNGTIPESTPAPVPEVVASNPEPVADAVLHSAPEMATPSPAMATPSVDIIV